MRESMDKVRKHMLRVRMNDHELNDLEDLMDEFELSASKTIRKLIANARHNNEMESTKP